MACLLGLGIFNCKVKEMGKWLKRKRQTIPSVGKDVEQLEPSYHLVGVNFPTSTLENSWQWLLDLALTQLLRSWVYYTQQKCNQTFIQRHEIRMLIVALLVLDTKGELLQCPSIVHGEVNDNTFIPQAMLQR